MGQEVAGVALGQRGGKEGWWDGWLTIVHSVVGSRTAYLQWAAKRRVYLKGILQAPSTTGMSRSR